MAKRTEPLRLEMQFPEGHGEQVAGPTDPLVAVFRRSIRAGNPTGDWMYLLARPSAQRRPKLLGTIAWTEGKRFLFFAGRHGEVKSTHPDKRLDGRDLDHVTLELSESMMQWSEHVATLGAGSNRGQGRSGRVHAGHLHPWFSILVSDLDGYGDVPAKFAHEFDVPATDKNRRSLAIMGTGCRSALTFPSVDGDGDHYYQLDVWAGRGAGWRDRYADALPWPSAKGVVSGHHGEPVPRSGSAHDLGDAQGVVVVLSRPSGTLRSAGLMHMEIGPAAAVAESGSEPMRRP